MADTEIQPDEPVMLDIKVTPQSTAPLLSKLSELSLVESVETQGDIVVASEGTPNNLITDNNNNNDNNHSNNDTKNISGGNDDMEPTPVELVDRRDTLETLVDLPCPSEQVPNLEPVSSVADSLAAASAPVNTTHTFLEETLERVRKETQSRPQALHEIRQLDHEAKNIALTKEEEVSVVATTDPSKPLKDESPRNFYLRTRNVLTQKVYSEYLGKTYVSMTLGIETTNKYVAVNSGSSSARSFSRGSTFSGFPWTWHFGKHIVLSPLSLYPSHLFSYSALSG